MPVKTFVVKGTYYYQAAEEVRAKRAIQGAAVQLQRDPSNQYDKHAVRVLLAESGAHLGHVPRVMSAFVSAQILTGAIREAHIRSVSQSSTYLEIKVTYEFEQSAQQIPSNTQAEETRIATNTASSPSARIPESTRRPKPISNRPRYEQNKHINTNTQVTDGTQGINWWKVMLVVCLFIVLILLISS